MIAPFSRRMWKAVAFIESGAEHFRQLDDAFENYDGHEMAAALWTLAAKRPKLAANLRRYVVGPEACAGIQALMGKTMAEIRKAAAQSREQGERAAAERLAKLRQQRAELAI